MLSSSSTLNTHSICLLLNRKTNHFNTINFFLLGQYIKCVHHIIKIPLFLVSVNEVNFNESLRRRVFSARWVGEKTRFVDRKGKGSPPFDHVQLNTGDKLDVEDFPVVYEK